MPERAKIVERSEFVEAANSGTTDGLALRKAFAVETKVIDPAERTIDFVISTATVDRMHDSIAVDGWQYDNYMRAPVVLWCHDSSSPPVGKALSVSKTADALLSRAQFMRADLSAFADMIFRMYQEKFLNAVSVGFIPTKYNFSAETGREFGLDFIEQELLEYSCCPVPANPEALVGARAAGIDTEPLRQWAEKLLDGGGHVLIPRELLEETFRQAKTPRTVRQKYLATKAADWKCGAARDLPLDQDEGWDGPAAESSIFAHAGGDNFNPEVARKGFLAYDASAPKLKGSYKEPFARVIGGALKAVKGGIRAAASRLPQADIGDSARSEAQGVIDHYEKAFGTKAASTENTPTGADGTMPPGNCGRAKDQQCGMIDPQECAVHMVPPETKTVKAGRRISAATAAKLNEAMGYHDAATKCLKDVLS